MLKIQASHRLWLGAIAIAVFSSCGRSLDSEKIATSIHSGMTQQGGNAVKSVICPDNIKPQVGNRFECVGVLSSGSGFAIAVNQQDENGNIIWEVPSVRGLLNMVKLQSEVETALKREMGQVKVDCGISLLRSVKPGEMFECQLNQKDAKSQPQKDSADNSDASKSPEQSESSPAPSLKTVATTQGTSLNPKEEKPSDIVQVTIQPSGDVNWQRIIKVPETKVATAKPDPAAKPNPTASPEATTPPESTPKPSPAAATSAEDFLNQPGAADDFD